jgi:hypothetical protein
VALQLLLDEQVSPVIAQQLRRKNAAIRIVSMQEWRDGSFLGAEDAAILRGAHQQQLTLVTYDVHTILPLVKELSEAGESFSGVIFIDRRTVRQDDIGGLVRALAWFWERESGFDWENRVRFLDAQ